MMILLFFFFQTDRVVGTSDDGTGVVGGGKCG